MKKALFLLIFTFIILIVVGILNAPDSNSIPTETIRKEITLESK